MYKKISAMVLVTSLLTSNAHAILSSNSNVRKVLKTVGVIGLACAASDYFLGSLSVDSKLIKYLRMSLRRSALIALQKSVYYMGLSTILGIIAYSMYNRPNFLR